MKHGEVVARDDGQLLAGRHDASWLIRPDTYRLKVAHVVVWSTRLGVHAGYATGGKASEENYAAACDSVRIMIAEFTMQPARQIDPGGRCQRPGCRARRPDEAGRAGG